MNKKYKQYKVSLDWLEEFLLYFDNGYTTVPSHIYNLNLTNNADLTIFVKEYILPNFIEETTYRKVHLKESLRYGLNFWSEEQFENLISSSDVIVSIPKNTTLKHLCLKIWKVMFENEDYHITNTFIYKEIPRKIYQI